MRSMAAAPGGGRQVGFGALAGSPAQVAPKQVIDRESTITVTKKLAEFRQTPGFERDIG